MKTLLTVLCLALLGTTAAQADTSTLGAPYQILGRSMEAADQYVAEDGIYADGERIVIDLGAGENTPDEDSIPQTITVIGTTGVAQAHFDILKKECTFPCGIEDSEAECHYEGYYSFPVQIQDFSISKTDIGTPITAFAGDVETEHMRNLWESRRVLDGVYVLPKLPATSPVLLHAHQKDAQAKLTLNTWDNVNRELQSTLLPEKYDITGKECIGHAYTDTLSSLTCDNIAMLLYRKAPLILSLEDYNAPAARVLEAFSSGGQEYYLVRLGLKGYTTVALLYKNGDTWSLKIRHRQYASMC
ncbi:MAG: hypothetical protein OXT65_03755 [Alphaproteobacteria bacterium]|nr:hypothetical protein [Alphaproteobacteria bacterium]